MQSETVKFTSW